MKKSTLSLVVALGATLACFAATAGNSLGGVRVGAKDPVALSKFYQTVFGMFEVQRMQTPQMMQIMLDFGATAEAARANPAPDLILQARPADDGADAVGHLVFNVTDIDAMAAAVKAAGGKMEREPFAFGNSGIRVAFALDPAGNHFELLQAPAPAK